MAFRGRGYEHAIDIPGHGRLTGVFSPTRAGRGEQVGLYFEPDGCHVFAPPQPGQGEPAAGQEAGAGAAGDPGTAGEASPAVAGPGLAENTPARTAPPRSPVTAGRRPAGRH